MLDFWQRDPDSAARIPHQIAELKDLAALSIPAPRVVISEEGWGRTNAHGDALAGSRSVFVQVRDCPGEFFSDPDLDARVELLRFVKHRHGQAKQTSGEAAWRHPDCSVNPVNGGSTRGGSQMVPRQSSWLLSGLAEHQFIGRIQLEDYHYIRAIGVLTASGAVQVNVPVMSGAKTTMLDHWTPAQLDPSKSVPRYNGQEINARYAFRISVKNPFGDGTPGDRLIGPRSQTIWCRPYPYPVWPTNDGFAEGVNSNQLTVSFSDGVTGN